MASFEVEVSSSSPFGTPSRSNLRDRWINRDSKSSASSFKNFKEFVESFSGQPNRRSPSPVHVSQNDVSRNDVKNKNTKNNDDQSSHADLFVHTPTYEKKENEENLAKETELISSNTCMTKKSQSHHLDGGSTPATTAKNTADKANVGGVSSLVRRWKDFEAEAKNSANNSPMATRTSSVESCNTYDSNKVSENGDNELLVDGFGDQDQSDKVVFKGKESDAVENEKMRVKKLIHKLTNDENGNVNEPSSPSACSGSPRLRGRQAFEDFLMVMQKDMQNELEGLVERKVVSRFSQKGRIQAMLRVQLLRGAMEAKDARKSNGMSFEVNRTPQPAIKRLSEIFKPISQNPAPEFKSLKKEVADSSKVEKSTSVQDIKCARQQEVATQTAPRKEAENSKNKESMVKSVIVEEKKAEDKSILNAASSRNVHENTKNKEGFAKSIIDEENKAEEKSNLPAASSGNVDEEACSRFDPLQEITNRENKSHSLSKSVETWVPSTEVKEVCSTGGDKNILHPSGLSIDQQENQHAKEIICHRTTESTISQEEWEEVLSNQYLTESENGWVSDVSHTQAGWEELHSDYERQEEGMQDWILDVSRPRSEWEGLRKERYQEMLDPYKQKEDISRLLESKSVSGFLSSGLRDRIDRLMISRTQQQLSITGSQTDEQGLEEEKSEYRVEREHEVEHDAIEVAECGDVGYYEDDEEDEDNEEDEDEIDVKQESVEYAHQTPSSLPFAPQGPQTINFTDQVEFLPLQKNSTPDSHSQDSRPPMTIQCSIEMDLKGHMEKLQKEVSEIRKSMKRCMSMQHKLRRSVKQDVIAALGHSGQHRGRHSTQKKGFTNGSMCSICNDDQVDTLMYRCGHMCTCFKCAHELQQGSGKCPVCQASIIDIVRVRANS